MVFIKIVFVITVSDHPFTIILCVIKSVRTAANQYISGQLSSNYTDLLNVYFSHRHTVTSTPWSMLRLAVVVGWRVTDDRFYK